MQRLVKTAVMLNLAMVLFFSQGMVCLADGKGSVTGNVTKTTASARYYYGEYGRVLTVKMNYYETHRTTGAVYSGTASNTVSGSAVSVSISRNSDEGYYYDSIYIEGYYDGKLGGTLTVDRK